MGKGKGVIKFSPGSVFSTRNKKSEQVDTLNDAMAKEAECGCGIDCCNKVLVLEDKAIPGDFYEIYIEDGELVHNKRV